MLPRHCLRKRRQIYPSRRGWTSLWFRLVLRCQPRPVSDDRIDKNVEDPRGEQSPLGDTTVTLKGVPIVPALNLRHHWTIPIHCQESANPWTHSVPLQDHWSPLPVQRAIGLMYINKDILQHSLAHSGDLLENFIFQIGCTHALLCLKPIQYVMKFNGHHQVPVNDDLNNLPQRLNKSNSLALALPPFRMMTIVAHVHSVTSPPILKASCTL